MNAITTTLGRLVAGALLAAAAVGGAAADTSASFAGKRMTVFIGFSPSSGIGYDTYGRMMARFLEKHMPGNPTVSAANKPGGGSMTLANYLFFVAPKDGTEIAILSRGVPMDRLVYGDKSTAKFDATKFNWLGSMNNEVSGFYVSDTAKAKSLSDVLSGTEVVVGSAGAGSDLQVFPLVMNSILKTRLKIISGYPGTNEILLSMEKGEVDGLVGYSWGAARTGSAEMLRNGKMKVLLQLALKKHADLPNVPLVTELVKSEEDQKVLELIFSRQSMGRPFAAPPNVSAATVATLRKAFTAVMTDPEMIAMAEKLKLEIDYVPGEEVQALVETVHRLPPAVIARTQKIVAGQ
jgi:tripartite-type tricarboxylate transporter receptor subunit TctC